MLTLKFGGTSVGSAAPLRNLVALVQAKQKKDRVIVVVSACGETTDQLLEMLSFAVQGELKKAEQLLREIEHAHLKLLNELVPAKKRTSFQNFFTQSLTALQELLRGIAATRDCSARLQDFVVGFGERWSANLVATVLSAHNTPAKAFMATELVVTDSQFGAAAVDYPATFKKLQQHLHPKVCPQVAVVTGFIGSDKNGNPTTLGRGGSDLTAAIVAAGLGAKALEIWTDVDGVFTADPRRVPEAFVIPQLSYNEVMEFAYFGAKVVHPKTVVPVVERNIPIWIKNTFNPTAGGTLIHKDEQPSPNGVKGVTSIEGLSLVMLEGTGIFGVHGIVARFFAALARKGINVVMVSMASSEQSLCCAIKEEEMNLALTELADEFRFEIGQGWLKASRAQEKLVVMAVVGSGMRGQTGLAGKLFSVLGRNGVNVVAVAQGATERNVTFVIAAKDETRALNLVHGAFHLSTNRVNVFMMGKGTIGTKLLEQIAQHHDDIKKRLDIDLRVIGLANSKKSTLLGVTGKSDLKKLIPQLRATGLENLIFVDATASNEIAKSYPEILQQGLCIATPNKRANTLPMKYYQHLQEVLQQKKNRYLYETAVGAGLPVISTLRDLLNSGDEVLHIEGVLSGTLSYIFSQLRDGASFSEAVLKAKSLGYTEPDPRDDLNGEDVARKMLILARELGSQLEMKDVRIENLVPTALRKVDEKTFLKKLSSVDQVFAKRVAAAKKSGKVLQYLGSFQKNKIEVGIREVAESSPWASLRPGDNLVVFTTKRYLKNPLMVKGPGAGPDVTAAGLLADILKLAQFLLR